LLITAQIKFKKKLPPSEWADRLELVILGKPIADREISFFSFGWMGIEVGT
jgi:hypothetical protein